METQKTIGFSLNAVRSLRKLFPFAVEGCKRNHHIIFFDFLRNQDLSHLKKIGEVREIFLNDLPQQTDIDVLFVLDSCLTPPRKSKVVAIHHSHHPIAGENKDPAAYSHYFGPLAGCDYLLLGQQNITNFTGNDFREFLASIPSEYHLPTSKATIIPAGYPSLEVLLQAIEETEIKKDAIFYAQVDNIQSKEEAENIKNVINILSGKYPHKEIIYSPHPNQNAIYDGAGIFEDIKKLNVSLNNDYSTSHPFARSEVLITDSSTTAITYSCATLRPHIQCQFNGYRKQATKTEFGWIIYSLEQLEIAIDYVKNNMNDYKEKLLKKRNELYIRVGKMAEYVIANISTIARGESLSEWISIPKDKHLAAKEYDPKAWFTNVANLPVGRKKIFAFLCGEYIFKNKNNNDLYSSFKKLTSSSRSFDRFNSYDLILCNINNNNLTYIHHSEYHYIFTTKQTVPLFMSCDERDCIEDFNLPKQYITKCFAGYLRTDTDKTNTGIQLNKITSEHKNFNIIIANHLLEKRFSVATNLFAHVLSKNGKIESPKTWPPNKSQLNIIFIRALLIDTNVRRMLSWEVQEKLQNSCFGRFMIWGGSGFYKHLRNENMLPDMNDCLGFIDNNKSLHGKEIDGKRVYSLQEALAKNSTPFTIILATSSIYWNSIIDQIKLEISTNKK